MSQPGPLDPSNARALDSAAMALRDVSREADALAGRVQSWIGGSATAADRALVAALNDMRCAAGEAADALQAARAVR